MTDEPMTRAKLKKLLDNFLKDIEAEQIPIVVRIGDDPNLIIVENFPVVPYFRIEFKPEE